MQNKQNKGGFNRHIRGGTNAQNRRHNNNRYSARGSASPLAQIGIKGLKNLSGRVNEEYLTLIKSWDRESKIYLEMRDDVIVGTLLDAIKLPLLKAPITIEAAPALTPGDEAAANWLTDVMHNMRRQTWESHTSDMLEALDFGFSIGEIVLEKRTDGRLWIKNIDPRGQETLDTASGWGFGIGQERDTALIFNQRDPDSGEVFQIPLEKCVHVAYRGRKGNPQGKALSPSTPIPTPDGWKTLETIQIGDKIFDENGCIRYVTGKADWENRPCYAMKFSTGDTIIADEEHEWLTVSAKERWLNANKKGKIRNTKTISETLKIKRGTKTILANHAIQWAKALDYPEQYLPIAPYLLGYWLGDGSSNGAAITTHMDDMPELVEALVESGYTTSAIKHNGKPESKGRFIKIYGEDGPWSSDSPERFMNHLHLVKNKHVPEFYMRGSQEQRLALLQGLMDSDGTIDDYGCCEFTNINKKLVEDVAELVTSLGTSVTARLRRKADSDAMDEHPGLVKHYKNDIWCTQFTPNFIPFRLQRKVDKYKIRQRYSYHYIIDVRKVENQRTICIETDSPSHLYLVGRALIPTHNSLLRSIFRTWRMCRDLENLEAIGIERDVGGMPVAKLPEGDIGDEDETDLRETLKNLRNDDALYLLLPNGVEVEPYGGGNKSYDVASVIDRKQKEILGRGFAQFLKLGMDNVGTQALVQGSQDFFMFALKSVQTFLLEAWNLQLVPYLFTFNNFPGMSGYPTLQWAEPGKVDFVNIINAMSAAVNGKLFTPTDVDEDKVREILDWPELPESERGLPRTPEAPGLPGVFDLKTLQSPNARNDGDRLAGIERYQRLLNAKLDRLIAVRR